MNYIKEARTINYSVLCHYSLRTYTKIWLDRSRLTFCPICNEELKIDKEIYIVINNTKLFPNSLVHAKCIIKPSSIEGMAWMDFYTATEVMYNNYLEYRSKYKAWFRD